MTTHHVPRPLPLGDSGPARSVGALPRRYTRLRATNELHLEHPVHPDKRVADVDVTRHDGHELDGVGAAQLGRDIRDRGRDLIVQG